MLRDRFQVHAVQTGLNMSTFEQVVIVGGCGHVGLPLGLVFASRGVRVTLLDIDKDKVEKVNRGEMPFLEKGAPELLRQVVGRGLQATLDDGCLAAADAAIAVVGTPVDRYLNPTLRNLCRSVDGLVDRLSDDSLLVLRSTVYPGVTKIVYDRVRALGRKVHVAFCPERIAEGSAIEELTQLPQIIAAFEPEAMNRTRKLFSILSSDIIELSPTEAELAKLFTNSWRYLNFAISNQFYVLAQSYGLDFYRIYDAVTRDYPRMASFSRAGFAAGPCLLKDTLQLAAFAGNNFFMGQAARLVNEGLPNYLVEQLRPSGLANKCVAILGMAFKADSDDVRDSLSYKLRKLLEVEAREVLCTDPYVQDPSLVPLEQALASADIFVLGAPHSVYQSLSFPADKQVVDVWNFWPKPKAAPLKMEAEVFPLKG
jgi:UDP-N-acetyl-D-mannosaminuronic acid dehydrogenase